MGQVHAKEAEAMSPGGMAPASDEIPLNDIRAKVVSVSVDGVIRTKNDLIMNTVQDLFKVNLMIALNTVVSIDNRSILQVEDFEDLVLTSQNVRGKLQDLGCFTNVGIHIDTSDTGSKDYTVTYQVGQSILFAAVCYDCIHVLIAGERGEKSDWFCQHPGG